jgi:hypothetical protein
MVEIPLSDAGPWRLVMPEELYEQLHAHLFPGDNDEHGAVIAAGLAASFDGGMRLLARDLHLAVDGHDYVPGKRGYRMLHADFVRDHILACRDERLVYLAVHNHGGTDTVGFSPDDFQSHERGYPALLDVANGMPVGALVFAKRALAGDIWLPDGRRVELEEASVVGRRFRHLSSASSAPSAFASRRDPRRDRQARLFGDAGQDILRRCKVGIIGLGGVGSLIAEYLGRLGVGRFVLIDPQRVEVSNLSRIGAYEQLEKLVVAIKTAVTDENDNKPYHLLFSKDDDWQSAYNLLFNVMSQALWLSNEAFEKTRDLNYRIFRRRPEGGAIEFGKQNYQFIATLRSELERILADDMLALHDVKRFLKQKRKKDEGFHQVLLPRA